MMTASCTQQPHHDQLTTTGTGSRRAMAAATEQLAVTATGETTALLSAAQEEGATHGTTGDHVAIYPNSCYCAGTLPLVVEAETVGKDEAKPLLLSEAPPLEGVPGVWICAGACRSVGCLVHACIFVLDSAGECWLHLSAIFEKFAAILESETVHVQAARAMCCRSTCSQLVLLWTLQGLVVGAAVHLWIAWWSLRLHIYSTLDVVNNEQWGWFAITALLVAAVGLRRQMCLVARNSDLEAEQTHPESGLWTMARLGWIVAGLTFALTAGCYCLVRQEAHLSCTGADNYSDEVAGSDAATSYTKAYTHLGPGDELLCTSEAWDNACVGRLQDPSSEVASDVDGIADWVKHAVPDAVGFATNCERRSQTQGYDSYYSRYRGYDSHRSEPCTNVVVLLSRGSHFASSGWWRWDYLQLYEFGAAELAHGNMSVTTCSDIQESASLIAGALVCWLVSSAAMCWMGARERRVCVQVTHESVEC